MLTVGAKKANKETPKESFALCGTRDAVAFEKAPQNFIYGVCAGDVCNNANKFYKTISAYSHQIEKQTPNTIKVFGSAAAVRTLFS